MKVSPWHSTKSNVYHDDTDCKTGNNIELKNRSEGKGGNRKCSECQDIRARLRGG